MQVADLERLYDYSCWANARILAAMAGVPAERLARADGGGHGSIRNTVVHMLSADWGWVDRCAGAPRGKHLDPERYPTAESLRALATEVEAHMRALLVALTDADLAREIEFVLGTGETRRQSIGDILQHMFIHGVHHRGQLAMLLRAAGCPPGNFDYVIYANDERRAPA